MVEGLLEDGERGVRVPLPLPHDPQSEQDACRKSSSVRIHFIIVMIRWTGLAPWEFEFPFPGSLISTFLGLKLHVSI